MSERAKRNFLRWLIIEVLTIIIATIHFIITPTHRPYAVPMFGVVLLGAVALVICWLVYKKRHSSK